MAPRKMNAAPTAIKFRGLMKLMGRPPAASRRMLTRERRLQNMKSVTRRKTSDSQTNSELWLLALCRAYA